MSLVDNGERRRTRWLLCHFWKLDFGVSYLISRGVWLHNTFEVIRPAIDKPQPKAEDPS